MNNNALDRFGNLKERVLSIIESSYKDGVINEVDRDSLNKNIEKEKLKIGVVGQIKYGKSTLLNAMIFRNQILPVASTPMTASLSYITYGEEEKVEVEFFSPEEWKELEEIARSNNNGYEVQAAKELLEKADGIKGEIGNLLGKKKTISMDKIGDYVGESGKYVPICKALKIYYPIENLRDVEFVDTPGFNDPIVSREARAKEFLSEADVVIVVLYAGRPFDKTDRELMFKKIRNIGTGKVVVVMNKKDTVFDEEGTEERALQRINEEFRKGLEEIKSQDNVMYNVFKDSRVIPLSSLWALFGVMNSEDINKDENLKWYYDDQRKKFPFLKTKDDFILHSGLKDLEKKIDEILRKDKYRIIVNKHLSFIIGKYMERIAVEDSRLSGLEMEKESLSKSLETIEKELEGLNKLGDEFGKFIGEKIIEIEESVKRKREEIKEEIGGILDAYLKNFIVSIPEKGLFDTHSSYSEKCNSIIEGGIIDMKNEISKKISKYRENKIQLLKDFVYDVRLKANELAGKYISYSSSDFQKMLEEVIKLYDESFILPEFDIDVESSGWWFFGTGRARREVVNQIKDHFKDLGEKIKEVLVKLSQSLVSTIVSVREKVNNEVINNIKKSLKRAKKNYDERKERISEIEKEMNEVEKNKESINKKLESIKKEIYMLMEVNI